MADIGACFPKDINDIKEQKKTSDSIDGGDTSHGIHVSSGTPISSEITSNVSCVPGSAEPINCSINVSFTQKIDDIMGTSDVLEEDEDLMLTYQRNNKRMKKTEQSDVPTTDLEVTMEEAGSSPDGLSHRINTSLNQRFGLESAKHCCTKSMSENSVVSEEGISMEVMENSSLDKASDCCLNLDVNSSTNGYNVLIDKSNGITTENHDVDMLLSKENPHSTENDVKLNVDSAETHSGETLRLASDDACNIHKNASIVRDKDSSPNLDDNVLIDKSKGITTEYHDFDMLLSEENPHSTENDVKLNVDLTETHTGETLSLASDNACNIHKNASIVLDKDSSPNLDEQSVASDADASSSQLDGLEGFASQIVNEIVDVVVQRAFPRYTGKKLLVLDVNGLLLDISSYVPYDYDPDEIILRKAVFKRPYCDDFLKFCFERFNVGIWSSKTKRNMEPILDFLLGNDKHKLLFCWDQSHCTFTGFSTVEKKRKPLLLKKLKKLWDKFEPDLPWEKGVYNESNTLLIDDSPHKALCNPLYTAIFPCTYHFRHVRDNSLGPEGDLRVYLEGLAGADNVQEYVKQNPFGQRAITEKNLSWGYYLKVIEASLSPPRPVEDEC